MNLSSGADEAARRIRELHDDAESRGEPMYQDPWTGLWVQTAAALAERGECCGSGCRHCPYPGGDPVPPDR